MAHFPLQSVVLFHGFLSMLALTDYILGFLYITANMAMVLVGIWGIIKPDEPRAYDLYAQILIFSIIGDIICKHCLV
jgi:hypothetical protein